VVLKQYNFFPKNDSSPPCDSCGVGISDLVRKVKKELANLEDSMANNNESAMFQLRDLELEISFVVHHDASGKIGGSYEVVTIEGTQGYSNEKVQKLILHWDAEKPKKQISKLISNKPLDSAFINSLKKPKQ